MDSSHLSVLAVLLLLGSMPARAQIHPDLDHTQAGVGAKEPALPKVDGLDEKYVKALMELTDQAVHGSENLQIEGLAKVAEFGQDGAAAAPKIRPLLDAPSADVARAAADALKSMGPAACPQWLDAAKSPDGFTRRLAMEALSDRFVKIRDIDRRDLYATLAMNFKDPCLEVRRPAAKSLCRFWPQSASLLVDAIKNGDECVKEVMLERLWYEPHAYLGETPGRDLKLGDRLVNGSPSEKVLIDLGQQLSPQILERLSSPTESTRKWALEIINQLPPEAISNSLADKLVQMMKGKDVAIAEDAAQMLTHLGDNAIPGLIEGTASKDDTIRWICVNALSERTTANSSGPAIRILRDGMLDQSSGIRKISFRWLDHLSTPPAGLVQALADDMDTAISRSGEEGHECVIVAAALGRFATEPKIAVPALVRTFKADNLDLTLTSIRSLRAFGADASGAVPNLAPFLKFKNSETANEAAATLSVLGAEGRRLAAHYYLDRLANGWHIDTRIDAIRGLAALGDEAADAVPLFAKLLTDDDNTLRLEVARALGGIGPKASPALPALTRMMDNRLPEVRRAAADALVRISPDGVGLRPALMAAVYNGDRACANRLAAVLQRNGDTDALIRRLNDLATDDPEPAVRAAAKHAVECLTFDATPVGTTQPAGK